MFDWNDLRAFLAVARAGRLTVAAQALQMDHSTLSRQIQRLETALKTRLFDRRPAGYGLTQAGEWLVKEAEAIESATIGIQSRLSEQVVGLAGSVRIGAPEGFGTSFLAPRIRGLSGLHPELEIELIANPQMVSLSKREAEMAITNFCPSEGRLIASKLTDYQLGLYASPAYLESRAPIRRAEDIKPHTFIGYMPDLLPTAQHAYLGEVSPAVVPRIRISNVLTQMATTLGGAGLCILPCFMAAGEALVRLLPDEIRLKREYWLIIHSDLRDNARVRAAADFVSQAVRGERRLFMPG